MSYDEKTDKVDWQYESTWMIISVISGVVLSFLFLHFERFPNAGNIAVIIVSCLAFYVLSILLRIQNKRGMILTAKPAVNEKYIKLLFPFIGFGVGLALIFL